MQTNLLGGGEPDSISNGMVMNHGEAFNDWDKLKSHLRRYNLFELRGLRC